MDLVMTPEKSVQGPAAPVGVREDARRPVRVYVPGRPSLTWHDFGPHRVVTSFWHHRALTLQLCRREIAARYRGSVLGLAWSFVTPLLMLAVYAFVFTVVFQARWDIAVGNHVEYALVLFAGLIVFTVFSECVGRAPGLIMENPSYVKRIVFPLEALGWVTLISSLINASISLGILSVGYLFVVGWPPATLLWAPLVLAPFSLMVLGLTWFLAPLGLYVRDVRQVVGVVLPVFMFASPVFYPVSALPQAARQVMALNPLAFTMDQLRAVALFGQHPDILSLAVFTLIAGGIAWASLAFFLATKRGFADVL
jgi:lipopolysaccharide transport system permease protein